MIFSLFHSIRSGKKGQLASLLTVILVVVLILAFLSLNLGKIGLTRTRLSNAADSASLAAGSVASQLMNYMASYNELMLMNFSGFVSQSILMIAAWIIDFVMALAVIIQLFTAAISGNMGGVIYAANMGWNFLSNLYLDALIIATAVEGATKVGESLEKRINELNPKLPKNTRNTLRQYSFMNAGIDEPKIDYDDWLAKEGKSNSDVAWKDYLNVETGFSAFMRTLSKTNDADTNYGAGNSLSYSWKDSHRGQLVDNTVEVLTTPMQSLSLEEKDFGNVATDSGLRSEMMDAIGEVDLSWWLSGWVKTAITLSPLILVLLELIRLLTELLALIIGIFIIVLVVLIVGYTIGCIYGGSTCDKLASSLLGFSWYVVLVGVLSTVTAIVVAQMDPSGIPAVMYGDDNNDLTVAAEINRKTAKTGGGDINYGLWRMQYPQVSAFSKAIVFGSGGGKLFPPVVDYNTRIIQIK